jgi:hypothetical protein
VSAARPDDLIALRPSRLPASETIHRPFLVASLSFAVLIGFVLGIHVPLGRLLDSGSSERTADLIQAHGQVQLLGFAGLFVIGMSLRLMPRFASARLAFSALVLPTLYLFIAGLFARAVVMPWLDDDAHSALLIGSLFAVLLGSACFLLIVAGTLAVEARRFDGSSLAFLLGALLLFGASAASTLAAMEAVRAGDRALPYLADQAIVNMQLFGFLLSFILSVALRAVPTMFGVERPGSSTVWLALLLAACTAVLASCLLYIQYVADAVPTRLAASLAFLGLGIVLLGIVWMTGVVRQAANRIRPSSQGSLWLIRSAMLWMLISGLACVFYGARATLNGELPAQLEFDGVRHMLGVGVVTILMTGMALMILPEVAIERQSATRQKQIALLLLLLLNLSAALRVLPSLASDRWSLDERNLSMAIAGSLAEIALVVFLVYLLRLLWRHRSA